MPRSIDISTERLVRRIPAASGLVQPVLGVDPAPQGGGKPHCRLIAIDGRFNGSRVSSLTIPTGVAPGDYAFVTHYRGFDLTGGAGVAWSATALVQDAAVEYRKLLPRDFDTALNFGTDTPYCAAFIRCSRPLSALTLRTSLNYSGATLNQDMAGFEPSGDAMAFIGISTMSSNGFIGLDAAQWPATSRCGENNWWATLHVRDRPRTWAKNAPFGIVSNLPASKTGAVFELRG